MGGLKVKVKAKVKAKVKLIVIYAPEIRGRL